MNIPMPSLRAGIVLIALFFCAALTATAQQDSILHLELQARGDYQREYASHQSVRDNCGFRGKYLNLLLSGSIGKHFSYAYRQRLNRMSKSSEFFDATDYLHLDFSPNPQWKFSAGKQIVAIGGFEYDRAPIDLYFASEYWNNIACYQWGASASFGLRNGKDKFLLQFCQSPFRSKGEDTYAYNIFWNGHHGLFHTLWSINFLEYEQGKTIQYISFGQAVDLGAWRLEFDLMNRTLSKHVTLLRDCSMIGEVSYRHTSLFRAFAKASYDVNRSRDLGDQCVLPGTEVTRIGCGTEYFPLRDNRIRVHASFSYSFGKNSNPDGTVHDRQALFNIGLTGKINLLNLKRKTVH